MSDCKQTMENRFKWVLDSEIATAHESLRKNAEIVANDPTRPQFHFLPPAGWMNDPNGTVYKNGYYHIFYQHNPYGDTWSNLHWGHARSRNLIDWEHLPIALSPSITEGEASCYSGSCHFSSDGTPMIFYTRVGKKPEKHPRKQWAAVSNDEMVLWKRLDRNLQFYKDGQDHSYFIKNWRDPFVFTEADKTLMVISAQLSDEYGGDFAILLYEAINFELTKWDFRHIIFRKPSYELSFLECPNFFRIRNTWILLTSPYKPVEYHVGTFDVESGTFNPYANGNLDLGVDYYATHIAKAPDGRIILFAWIRGFHKGRGWNGCLALPREIDLDNEGVPVTQPASELVNLRKTPIEITNTFFDENELLLDNQSFMETFELECSIKLNEATAVDLRILKPEKNTSEISIKFDGFSLDIFGNKIHFNNSSIKDSVYLHVYVDRTVIEAFIDDGHITATKVVYFNNPPTGISLRSFSGRAFLEMLRVWPLRKACITPELGIE